MSVLVGLLLVVVIVCTVVVVVVDAAARAWVGRHRRRGAAGLRRRGGRRGRRVAPLPRALEDLTFPAQVVGFTPPPRFLTRRPSTPAPPLPGPHRNRPPSMEGVHPRIPLEPDVRDRFDRGWRRLEDRFAADPLATLPAADALARLLLDECGYADAEAADLSRPVPVAVAQYVAARTLAGGAAPGASGEDLRTAFVAYQQLVRALLTG